MDIQLEQTQPFSLVYTSVREAHGFAQAGGVMGAVKAYLKEEADKINALQVSDINKKNIALLRACAKTGKAAGQFIEVAKEDVSPDQAHTTILFPAAGS